MRTPTIATFALACLLASVTAAPIASPEAGIIGSIVNPSAGNDNLLKGNGDSNGNSNGVGNGNDNTAGKDNGNDNSAGDDNSINLVRGIIGSITNPSAGDANKLLHNGVENGNENGEENGNNNSAGNGDGNGNSAGDGNSINLARDIIGSITSPSAGDGNKLLGNGNDNGNGNGKNNGNGNEADNDNGNGNSAGNGNSINVSPDVSPDITLPSIKFVPSEMSG